MILGVAGDLLCPDEPRNHYLTKVGGVPCVPSSSGGLLASGCNWRQSTICGDCGRGLSLVFQAYAPVVADCGNNVERVLLVLGCAHPSCGKSAQSWRAFRCQLTPAAAVAHRDACGALTPGESYLSKNQELMSGPAAATVEQQDAPSTEQRVVGSDPFGAGFDCMDGFRVDGGGGLTDNAASDFDFSDLGAVLEDCAFKQRQQLGVGRGEPGGMEATAGGSKKIAAGDCVNLRPPSMELPIPGPLLPEFHIVAVEEPSGKGGTVGSGEEERVLRLLEEYERQERAGGQGLGASHVRSDQAQPHRAAAAALVADAAVQPGADMGSGLLASGGCSNSSISISSRVVAGPRSPSEAGDEMGSWAGEEYEEDHVRGVQGAYLKFAARLARCPEQCARYERGGDTLWPLRELPQPPPCVACGAARVLELQLMAPLLAMVLDCGQWLQGPDLEKHRPAINAAANWDFTTLAIYTCSGNCNIHHPSGSQLGAGGQDDVWLTEEFLALASEEQSHVPDELVLPKYLS